MRLYKVCLYELHNVEAACWPYGGAGKFHGLVYHASQTIQDIILNTSISRRAQVQNTTRLPYSLVQSVPLLFFTSSLICILVPILLHLFILDHILKLIPMVIFLIVSMPFYLFGSFVPIIN